MTPRGSLNRRGQALTSTSDSDGRAEACPELASAIEAVGQGREPLGTSTPARPRPYLLAVEIPPLLSQPSSRSNALPLRQFVKDWFGVS